MSGWDRLWVGGHLATMRPGEDPYGVVRDGAVAVRDGRVVRVGPRTELLDAPEARGARVHEAGGAWITPGLVDCHTHLVFAGDRADEFERRLRGESYEEIARSGGGILSTVRATRAADEETLLAGALRRGRRLADEGVVALEVKSGYGLDTGSELRMLRVARRLEDETGLAVRATLLGAHALPPEFRDDRAGYLRLVVEEMIPRAAREGLADAVDAFCDEIAFSAEECRRVLEAGRAHGLVRRLHADQLTDAGGAALAADVGARSADHLERASPEGVRAMARAGTVAVLLPGAYHYLGDDRPPPVDVLRAEGVPMAVATDLNPGSSPVCSLLLAMSLACVHFGLTPAEALAGATRHAARVLGMEEERGVLAPGRVADLALWEVDHPRELAYWSGWNPCVGVAREGRPPGP